MKNALLSFITLLLTLSIAVAGENKQVTNMLNQRYGYASYYEYESSDYYVVRESYSEKPGICDAKGNVLVPTGIYEDVSPAYYLHVDQYVKVPQNGMWGVYDVKNRKVINPIKYNSIYFVSLLISIMM